MKTIIYLSLFTFATANHNDHQSSVNGQNSLNSCSIEVVLEAKQLPIYTYVLNYLGELEDNARILTPIIVDEGTYSVTVTRKGSNLYKVDTQNIYIKTRFCYEYVYYQDAYLDLMKVRDIMVGEITFR